MRGFLVGTFALAVLYAVVQPGASSRITEGTGLAASSFRRLTGAGVAGIPNRAQAAPAAAAPTTPSSSGGTSLARYTV